MVIEFLQGKKSNGEIIKKYGVKNVVKYYNLIRQMLFATAMDFPKETIELIKKATRKVRSTESRVDKVAMSKKLIKAVMEGQSLSQFAKDNGLSGSMANILFWDVADSVVVINDSNKKLTPRNFTEAHRKEFETWLNSK